MNNKEVRYSKETDDWEMLIEGRPVGFAETPQEAWERLNAQTYAIVAHPHQAVPTGREV